MESCQSQLLSFLLSDARRGQNLAAKMLKFVFGRGASPPWAPQRGVAPAPHRGLGGPWTPALKGVSVF